MIHKTDLLEDWKNDSLGLAVFLGSALSHVPSFTDAFCISFGESLFSALCMDQRINHLYEPHHRHRDKKEFQKTVTFGCRERIVYIEDRIGDYNKTKVMLLRNLDPPSRFYAIRVYADRGDFPHGSTTNADEHVGNHDFWNFINPGKLKVKEPSEGFLDLQMTRRVAKLIEWTSNMLGFEKELPRG